MLIINKGHIVAEDLPGTSAKPPHWRKPRHTSNTPCHVEDLLPLVQAVPGIITATIHSDDTLEFGLAPNQDARPGVARTVIEHGFDLSNFHPENLNLEDIFLQLTRDEPEFPVIQEINDEEDEIEEPEEEENGNKCVIYGLLQKKSSSPILAARWLMLSEVSFY